MTRIVRYESGTGEVIEIIEVPDPHNAAEYKVPTNDELRPKPGCRFKGKTAIRVSGRRNAFIHPSAWKGYSPKFESTFLRLVCRWAILELPSTKGANGLLVQRCDLPKSQGDSSHWSRFLL